MKVEEIAINKVLPNNDNPRIIKDEKFKKLVNSIKNFPEMLQLRPIVVNDEMIVLGGNMRLKACKEAGLKKVFIIKASNITKEQQHEFIIKDNVGFGEWNYDTIANEWNAEKVLEWGLDVWPEEEIEDEPEDQPKAESIVFKIKCDNVEQLEELKQRLDIQDN